MLSVPEEDQVYPDGESWRYDWDMGPGTITHLAPDMSVLSADDYQSDPGVFL